MAEPIILNGRILASEISEAVRQRADEYHETTGKRPLLAIILVGDNENSEKYIRLKRIACEKAGIDSRLIIMSEKSTTEDVIDIIRGLNQNRSVSGILLQHPIPMYINERKCFDAIDRLKDVDGVGSDNFGTMSTLQGGFKCAAPLAIMALMERFGVKVEGKEAVVVGRSSILGKPISMMLLNASATVTTCHTKTTNLPEHINRADIVVAAASSPGLIKADWIKPQAVLIEAGYNGGGIGDIDLDNAAAKSSAYTPLIGGVGPVTIAKLIEQTMTAAELALRKRYS